MDKFIRAATYVQNHIIFVHGLMGDAHTSWISGGSVQLFDWPAELQRQLKQTAVWKFNYSSRRKISKIASDLLKEIKNLQLDQSAQIVFIVHSLGGIVVKELKRILYELPETNTDRKILDHIKGVVFISTPHRGSKLAGYPRKYSPLYFWVNKDTVKKLTLDDPYLIDLDKKYLEIVSKFYIDDAKKIDIYDFYETKGANIFDHLPNSFFVDNFVSKYKIIKKIISKNVNELEDIIIVDGEFQRKNNIQYNENIFYVTDTDHFSISKPKNKNNIIHKSIKKILSSNNMK